MYVSGGGQNKEGKVKFQKKIEFVVDGFCFPEFLFVLSVVSTSYLVQ